VGSNRTRAYPLCSHLLSRGSSVRPLKILRDGIYAGASTSPSQVLLGALEPINTAVGSLHTTNLPSGSGNDNHSLINRQKKGQAKSKPGHCPINSYQLRQEVVTPHSRGNPQAALR
jgi:hypothetical protein